MKQELEDIIYNDFPHYFPLKTYPNGQFRTEISVGDGWFNLVYNLLEDIDVHQKVQVLQVKEKLGGLRFYIDAAQEEVHNLIDKAECESYNICESCGSKNSVTSEGRWIKTLCKECRDGRTKGVS